MHIYIVKHGQSQQPLMLTGGEGGLGGEHQLVAFQVRLFSVFSFYFPMRMLIYCVNRMTVRPVEPNVITPCP